MSDFLTLKEAREHYKVSSSTVRRWAKEKRLATKEGHNGRTLFSKVPNTQIKALPNFGIEVIPPVQQQVGIYSAGQYFYRNPDEAILNSRENAERMFNDICIQEPLNHRMLTCVQTPWHIDPEDATSPEQAECARQIQRMINDIPQLQKMLFSLAFACWFGKSGVQLTYDNKYVDGKKVGIYVKRWSSVNGDSIYYKFTEPSERIGILVTPKSLPGTKYLTTESTDLGLAHVLDDFERESFIIHTFYHLAGDYLRPDQAGRTKGVGLRSQMYWVWWTKCQTFMILQEYLERVGTGMTIYPYEMSNDTSYQAMLQLAQSQAANAVQLYPIMPGSSNPLLRPERIEPTGQAVENLMTVIRHLEDQLKLYIVGQSLSSEAKPTGMGSGVADLHARTELMYRKFDTQALAETLSKDLVDILMKYCYPNATFKCKWIFDTEEIDKKEFMQACKDFYEIGGELDADSVRETLGLPKPTKSSIILSKANALQNSQASLPGMLSEGESLSSNS